MALILPVVFGCDVFDFECVLPVSARDQLVPVLVNEPVQSDEKNVLVRIADPRDLAKKADSSIYRPLSRLLKTLKQFPQSLYVSFLGFH